LEQVVLAVKSWVLRPPHKTVLILYLETSQQLAVAEHRTLEAVVVQVVVAKVLAHLMPLALVLLVKAMQAVWVVVEMHQHMPQEAEVALVLRLL
jgi:hypothetical protein